MTARATFSNPLDLLPEILRGLRRARQRDTQGLPGFALERFGNVNDLADVVGGMGNIEQDRVEDFVGCAFDRGCGRELIGVESIQRGLESVPPIAPGSHDVFARVRLYDELAVAIAVRFFAVAVQKVGPARTQISTHVLYNDREAVRSLPVTLEELFIIDLLQCAFGQRTLDLVNCLYMCNEIRFRTHVDPGWVVDGNPTE